MKKTILVLTAAAFLGTGSLAPTPAAAIPLFLPLMLQAKEDKKFKAVNPYAAKKAVKKKGKKKGKKKM